MVGGGEDGQIAEVKLHQPLVIDQNRLGLNYLLTKLFVQRTKFVNNLVEIWKIKNLVENKVKIFC